MRITAHVEVTEEDNMLVFLENTGLSTTPQARAITEDGATFIEDADTEETFGPIASLRDAVREWAHKAHGVTLARSASAVKVSRDPKSGRAS